MEIAGREVPTPAVVGVAVVGGVLLILYVRGRAAAGGAAAASAPLDTTGGGGAPSASDSSSQLSALQQQEQQDISTLQSALTSQTQALQDQLTQQQQSYQQALDAQSQQQSAALAAMQQQENSALAALQAALAKLQGGGGAPGGGGGGGGGNGPAVALPPWWNVGHWVGLSQLYLSHRVTVRPGDIGAGWDLANLPNITADAGLSAGTHLVLPVAYHPGQDTGGFGLAGTGGESGWHKFIRLMNDTMAANPGANVNAAEEYTLGVLKLETNGGAGTGFDMGNIAAAKVGETLAQYYARVAGRDPQGNPLTPSTPTAGPPTAGSGDAGFFNVQGITHVARPVAMPVH